MPRMCKNTLRFIAFKINCIDLYTLNCVLTLDILRTEQANLILRNSVFIVLISDAAITNITTTYTETLNKHFEILLQFAILFGLKLHISFRKQTMREPLSICKTVIKRNHKKGKRSILKGKLTFESAQKFKVNQGSCYDNCSSFRINHKKMLEFSHRT